MRILSTAGATIRHGVGAAAEAALVVAIAVTLVFGVAVVTRHDPAGAGAVFAAKGGQDTTSWIALASVNGSSASVQPTLGDSVSFSTGYPNNVQNPRIEVLCYQNGSLVYGAAGAVTDSFLLGGGGSIWLTNGGSATCTANLFYFGQHAGSQTYNVLATTSFSAAG